jgi:hypothetical protein
VSGVYEQDQSWGKALLAATITAFTAAPAVACAVAAVTTATGWLEAGLVMATWVLVVLVALLAAKLVFAARYRAKMTRDGIPRYQAGPYQSWK